MSNASQNQKLRMPNFSDKRSLKELAQQLADSRQELNDLRAQLVATHGEDFTDVLEVPA